LVVIDTALASDAWAVVEVMLVLTSEVVADFQAPT
jgi:hypothetical protein